MINETTNCVICGKSNFKFLFPTKDRFIGNNGTFYLYECLNCNLRFLNPRPNYDFLRKYYPHNYSPYLRTKNDWRDKLELFIYHGLNNKLTRILFSPFKYIIRRGLIIYPGGKLLDVGCGSGNFLRTANHLGMKCYGCDIYSGSKNISFSDKIIIYNKKAENLHFPDNTFDLITLNHVLEHIENPKEILIKLKNFIKVGGKIIIQVPNAKSLISIIFGRYYQGIDSPRHLFVFNKKNIKILCDEVELIVEKTEYRVPVTNNVFIFSIIYFLEENFFKNNISTKLRASLNNVFIKILFYPFSMLFTVLNLGDGLEVYLSKKNG